MGNLFIDMCVYNEFFRVNKFRIFNIVLKWNYGKLDVEIIMYIIWRKLEFEDRDW